MIIDKNNANHFIADKGKVFRRKSDHMEFGGELYLGLTFYIGEQLLATPLMELVEHYEEIPEDAQPFYDLFTHFKENGDLDNLIETASVIWKDHSVYVNNIYIGTPETQSYSDIKAVVVKFEYSYDNQIAILCNKDDGSQESELQYNQMQMWRNFAAVIAKLALISVEK